MESHKRHYLEVASVSQRQILHIRSHSFDSYEKTKDSNNKEAEDMKD
jgi:hypothetical protein